MTIDKFRLLGWLIPVLCSGVSGWVVYQSNVELRNSSELRNRARIEVQQAIEQKKLIEKSPVELRYASVDDSTSEEFTFITYLKTSAASCGVTLTNLTSLITDAATDEKAKGKKADPLMKGIQKRDTILVMTGSYMHLRTMLSTLESSLRLLALTNLTWTRTETGTSVSIDVTRFVIPLKKKDG